MKKRLRSISMLLAATLIITVLSGCDRLGTELVDLMIIQGIAIDVTDSGYTVCVQTLNNAQSSFSNGENKAQSPSLEYHSEGETVAVALENAVTISGKEPMYAHNRIILIGEKAAKRGINDILDFFVRDYNTRPTVPIAVAKESDAKSVLEAKIESDLISSVVLEDILKRSNLFGRAVDARVLDTVNYSHDTTAALCLPAVITREDGEYKELSLDGTAVFNENNCLTGYLSDDETFGLMLINGKTDKGVFSLITDNNETVTLVMEKVNTRVEVAVNDEGVPEYSVNIYASCDVNEYLNGRSGHLGREAIERISQSGAAELEKLALASLSATLKDLNCDCFRFGRRLWLSNRKAYDGLEPRWKSVVGDIPYTVTGRVTIRRIGEESFLN